MSYSLFSFVQIFLILRLKIDAGQRCNLFETSHLMIQMKLTQCEMIRDEIWHSVKSRTAKLLSKRDIISIFFF